MPGTLNDLLKFFDHVGVTIDDSSLLKSAAAQFKGGIIDLSMQFKPNAIAFPEGAKTVKIEWTQENGV